MSSRTTSLPPTGHTYRLEYRNGIHFAADATRAKGLKHGYTKLLTIKLVPEFLLLSATAGHYTEHSWICYYCWHFQCGRHTARPAMRRPLTGLGVIHARYPSPGLNTYFRSHLFIWKLHASVVRRLNRSNFSLSNVRQKCWCGVLP